MTLVQESAPPQFIIGTGSQSSFLVLAFTGTSQVELGLSYFWGIFATKAPKPTLAKIASSADTGHKGDADDRGRKNIAENAPIAAKVRRRGFLYSGRSAMLPIEMTVSACKATDIE